ncbi:Isocitrate dehydrogenase [NAD] subunit gamma 1, mitochondrial [Saguinus oedipus]|uniref:Isocitric dehydrogenase subunit gamma n=1 Tax=Saguinus oedipus TaxID=9490 RepID=A0ABQ9TQS1_SAGOE|nr:Isocitrate dehydrogenase [NAD] subunit gamma 1, mitochondrial [Saguinus oedipus]
MTPPRGASPHNERFLHQLSRFQARLKPPVDSDEEHVSSNADEEDIRNAIMAIRQNHVALKGNIETNHDLPPSHKSRNNILRAGLDLCAKVVQCKSLPGVATRHKDIDIVIVRENTEGEYSSLERESVAGVVESLKVITKAKSLRVAKYAFKLAQESGLRRVTAVHKATMKLGDGLFLPCCREVAAGYPQITFEKMIVDNTTVQLVSRP